MSSSKIQRYALGIFLCGLVVSVGLNFCLFSGIIKPFDERPGEEATLWISGHFSEMWDDFSVGLTPGRAVLSLKGDRKLDVSVKGSYWAPFYVGLRPFYFKIYDRRIDYRGAISDDEPELLDEKNVFANKSQDELDYVIPIFNFTVLLNTGGIHLYIIVGATWSNVTINRWDCIATFALNIV